MIYVYIRVSSDEQTIENQMFEIEWFCNDHGYIEDGWIEETISDVNNYDKRKLRKLLEVVKKMT